MASRAAKTQKTPVQVKLASGSVFVCSCGSKEFRITGEDDPMYLFCRCGKVYTAKDLPSLEGS